MLPGIQTEKKIVEWIDNIIGVPTKELGLLISDGVRRWRTTNQLNTLEKAIKKAAKLKLPLKVISPKLICPLLENCSLEEDEYMQDKWANMLINMLDSEKNIQNHVFPFILGQISKNEFQAIDNFYKRIWNDLNDNISKNNKVYNELTEYIEQKEEKLSNLTKHSDEWYETNNYYNEKIAKSEIEIRKLSDKGQEISTMPYEILEIFEFENLNRLGLVKIIPKSEARAFPISKRNLRISVNVSNVGFDYQLTDLGEKFIFACNELE